MKRFVYISILFSVVCVAAFYAVAQDTGTSALISLIAEPTVSSSIRQDLEKTLHLGPNAMWSYISLALSFVVLIELLNSARRGINLADLLSRILIVSILALSIYPIIGLIEGMMKSLAQQIQGSTSYWSIVKENVKVFSKMSLGEEAKQVFFFFTNPLITFLNIFNFFSYLFVLMMLWLIEIGQETILSVLHAVAPIIVSLYIIPELNLLPSYIMLFFAVSSWSFFAAVIGKIVAVKAANGLWMATSVESLIRTSIANIVAGISVLGIARFSIDVFHAGSSVGGVVSGLAGMAFNGMKSITSAGFSAAIGGIVGFASSEGRAAPSPASSGNDGVGAASSSGGGSSSPRPLSSPPSDKHEGTTQISSTDAARPIKSVRVTNAMHGMFIGALLKSSGMIQAITEPSRTMKTWLHPEETKNINQKKGDNRFSPKPPTSTPPKKFKR